MRSSLLFRRRDAGLRLLLEGVQDIDGILKSHGMHGRQVSSAWGATISITLRPPNPFNGFAA
jgi:hypothetical protein